MTDHRFSIPCEDCGIGDYAVYGPAKILSSHEISSRRRSVIKLGPGRNMLREGETTAQYFTLRSGWAFRFKRLDDGRRQILSFVLPGDPVNLENLYFTESALLYSVQSVTDIVACAFSLTDMVEIVHSSRAQKAQLKSFLRGTISATYERLADIGRRSALGRVSHLLLELEERLRTKQLSSNGQFDFPVRQEDLADAVGLTTVYVNRTLDRLRRLGVLEYDRERMTILSMEKLKEIAEEE